MIWVNAKKKLPKKRGKYIVYKGNKYNSNLTMEIEWFTIKNKHSDDPDERKLNFLNKNSKLDKYVAYWEELPEIPK